MAKFTKLNIGDTVASSDNSKLASVIDGTITELVIPEGITTIRRNALWGCSSLTSIVIPDSVTSIGTDAFSGCHMIQSATLPAFAIPRITEIAANNIKRAVITSGESISASAFSNCSFLESVFIPVSVTSIGTMAFWFCSALADVYYEGTEEEWAAVEGTNQLPTNATIHYNATR